MSELRGSSGESGDDPNETSGAPDQQPVEQSEPAVEETRTQAEYREALREGDPEDDDDPAWDRHGDHADRPSKDEGVSETEDRDVLDSSDQPEQFEQHEATPETGPGDQLDKDDAEPAKAVGSTDLAHTEGDVQDASVEDEEQREGQADPEALPPSLAEQQQPEALPEETNEAPPSKVDSALPDQPSVDRDERGEPKAKKWPSPEAESTPVAVDQQKTAKTGHTTQPETATEHLAEADDPSDDSYSYYTEIGGQHYKVIVPGESSDRPAYLKPDPPEVERVHDDGRLPDKPPAGEDPMEGDDDKRSRVDRFKRKVSENADDLVESTNEIAEKVHGIFDRPPAGSAVPVQPVESNSTAELQHQGGVGDVVMATFLVGVMADSAVKKFRSRRPNEG